LLNFYSRQHVIELSQSPNLRQKPDILVFELLQGHQVLLPVVQAGQYG
jgi:hypothetical protein